MRTLTGPRLLSERRINEIHPVRGTPRPEEPRPRYRPPRPPGRQAISDWYTSASTQTTERSAIVKSGMPGVIAIPARRPSSARRRKRGRRASGSRETSPVFSMRSISESGMSQSRRRSPRGGEQSLARPRPPGARRAREAARVLGREQELPLCRDEVRAVDGEKRLSPAHGLPRPVHVQLLDVSGELRVDRMDAAFVLGDDAVGLMRARRSAAARPSPSSRRSPGGARAGSAPPRSRRRRRRRPRRTGASSAYLGTSSMSMKGDLPGWSKWTSGFIGSYQ